MTFDLSMASVLVFSRTVIGIGWMKGTASHCSLEDWETDVSSAMVRKFCVLCVGVEYVGHWDGENLGGLVRSDEACETRLQVSAVHSLANISVR
jgi:hypothetical protein